MIYCSNCARILDEDVQFCPQCNAEDPDWKDKEPEQEYISRRFFRGETFDKLREINQHIESSPKVKDESRKYYPKDGQPSLGMYIGLILLAVCLSFVGIIVGIVYSMHRNKDYRALGVFILTLSLIFTLFGTIFSAAMIFLV